MTGQELLTFLREIEDTNPDMLSENIEVLNLDDEEPFYYLYAADTITSKFNEDGEFEDTEPYIRLVIE